MKQPQSESLVQIEVAVESSLTRHFRKDKINNTTKIILQLIYCARFVYMFSFFWKAASLCHSIFAKNVHCFSWQDTSPTNCHASFHKGLPLNY